MIGALLAGTTAGAEASSHREAPLITEDPVADITDVYAFVSPDDATVTLVANLIPFEAPAGGPNFHKFGDDVLYQLNVDNDGDPEAEIEYQFRFTTRRQPEHVPLQHRPGHPFDDADLNVAPDLLGHRSTRRTASRRRSARTCPWHRPTSDRGPPRTTRRTSARRPSGTSAAASLRRSS